MARRKFLSEADLNRVTEATRQAELKTSGEIVTVITARAGIYAGHVLLVAATVMFLFSVLYLSFLGPVGRVVRRVFWAFDVSQALWVLFVGQILVFALTYVLLTAVPGLKALLIPKRDKVAKVRRNAQADFFGHHIATTKGHTGVLIYIARFERRVELLVDSGIAAKVKPEAWKSVVDGIIAGVCRKAFVDDLCAQILRVGEILSKDFPHRAGDKNELPDRPVVE